MAVALQPSLLDLAPDDGADVPQRGALDALRRTPLARGAWVDHLPGWLGGSGALFDHLAGAVPWRAERRRMYERVVDVPRLIAWYGTGEDLPHRALAAARDALTAHYLPELGEPLTSAGMCFYRSGSDSVAWHGDTIGRGATHDTVVAIVSVGDARTLALRPRGGGASLRFSLGHGDLLVMGGSCQRTWEHAVPKATGGAGPRISIQFRPAGVA
jgi:alkylated DNA repair dioxygenase AlkB